MKTVIINFDKIGGGGRSERYTTNSIYEETITKETNTLLSKDISNSIKMILLMINII